MLKALRRLLAAASLSFLLFQVQAQPVSEEPVKKETRPFKILTSGKDVTIKSNKPINHVMLWTSSGNRLVEQKDINNTDFTFRIPVNGSYFFLMIALTNGKVYTEKIGVRQ